MNAKSKTLLIRTPEGILFPMEIAGPATRFLAILVDQFVIMAIAQLLSALLGMLKLISFDFHAASVSLAYFLISIGYPMLLEWVWRGQTIGKRMLKIRVIDEQGLKLQPSQVVIRNLLRFVDVLPAFYMVGGIMTFLSPRGQRFGDIAGNTIVVRHAPAAEPDLKQILKDKYNSFRSYPHLAARLRQHVSPREAGIALEALMRRDMLDAQARLELFADLASHFAEVVRFPQEVTDGLSDERYVRNVVDILFREQAEG